eukprot:gene23637-32007_t
MATAVDKHAEELALQELLFGSINQQNTSTTKRKSKDDKAKEKEKQISLKVDGAVWFDDEEANLEIDLNTVSRLKKLKKGDSAVVSGLEFSESLKERFSVQHLEWAVPQHSDQESSLLRQSEALVSKANHYGLSSSSKTSLPSGKIGIKRLVNANITEPATASIFTMGFHSAGNVLLTGGGDKHLRFFKIDGEKNEKMLTVKLDLAVRAASFVGRTSEVFVCGRLPYFYSYDTTSGAVTKMPGPLGHDVKSLESMTISPSGDTAGFLGPNGSLHLLSTRSKQWNMHLRMNSAARSISFLGDHTLISSGLDADVYVWDIRRPGKCINRFTHDDGTCTTSLSSHVDGFVSIGSESGVVSIFKADDIVARDGREIKQVKSLMNLTTQITSSAFHPSGQVLAVASNQKKDRLKLVHLPTCSVFSNWPTDRTPLGIVESLAFSPNGGYLAIGNHRGFVLLYQLEHFGAA